MPVTGCLALAATKNTPIFSRDEIQPWPTEDEQMYPRFLVVSQFVLSAVLVLSVDWWPVPKWPLLLASPGILLIGWSVGAMGLSKTRIHPTPSESTRLVTPGPYRFVRHPMYLGLLWLTGALLTAPPSLWRVGVWFVLLAVLVAKSRIEDRALKLLFSEYAHYASNVGGLLPKPFGKR